MSDGAAERIEEANQQMQDQIAETEAQHEATKERRANRTLDEKLADMAKGAQAKVDRLKEREYKLVQDLGKVRGELQTAQHALAKLQNAASSSTAAPAPSGER